MRRWSLGIGALIFVFACNKDKGGDEVEPEESAAKPTPSATPPAAPTAMGATDFCKLIFEAPKRSLDKVCNDADKKSAAYADAVSTTRTNVQACWSMLSQGVQNKRLTLPAAPAQRCAAALEKLPWHEALHTSIADVAECHNIAIGLAGAGKPCRSAYECGPGLFCSGGQADLDGVCMKKVAAGDSCKRAAWDILGEDDAACEAGLFCDHGGEVASDPLAIPPAPTRRYGFDPLHDPFSDPTPRPPSKVRLGQTTVSGRLPPEVIQRIVRSNFGRFRVCYENGLRTNPNLQGRVTVRFVISRSGTVSSVSGTGDMPDAAVTSCVTRAFYSLTFPQPEGGIVTVSYPIVFTPSGDGAKPSEGETSPPPPSIGPPTQTCLAVRKEGDDCRASRECGALSCVVGKCGKPLADGAECRVDEDCGDKLHCIAEAAPKQEGEEEGEPAPVVRKCQPARAADAACTSDAECLGACVDSKCAAFCGSG